MLIRFIPFFLFTKLRYLIRNIEIIHAFLQLKTEKITIVSSLKISHNYFIYIYKRLKV